MPTSKKNQGRNHRADHLPGIRQSYEKARQRLLRTATTCAICGGQLDPTLKPPNPLATEIDHVVPLSRHGDPADPANLQAVHAVCNRRKGNKLIGYRPYNAKTDAEEIGNRNLPLSYDWKNYRASDDQTEEH